MKVEVDRLAAVRAALLATTSTRGWAYIKKIAANVVEKAIQDSLDEEDRDRGEAKRLKAKALQAGLAELFNAIESAKNFDPSQFEDQTGLGELERE